MKLEGKPRLAQRAVRTELACARSLLDELEAMLDAESEARMRRDLAVQLADQLARVASAMRYRAAERPRDGPRVWDGESFAMDPFDAGDERQRGNDRESEIDRREEETEGLVHERKQVALSS